MSDTASSDEKTKVLSLKGGSSTVRQSFSHGRSKSVVVETKRKRILSPPLNSTKKITKLSNDNASASEKTASKNISSDEVNRRVKALEAVKAEEAKRKKEEAVAAEVLEKTSFIIAF